MIEEENGIEKLIKKSKQEHEFVLNAKEKYSEFFNAACKALNYLEFFEDSKSSAFIDFQAAVWRNYNLAVLSLVRDHFFQACLSLRVATEATALASFSLYSEDENLFVKNDKGIFMPNDKNLKQAYTFLEENFPPFNIHLKGLKDKVNSNFAHSSHINSAMNIVYYPNENMKMGYFFDIPDVKAVKDVLFVIIGSIWTTLRHYTEFNIKFRKSITFKSDMQKNIIDLEKEIKILRKL